MPTSTTSIHDLYERILGEVRASWRYRWHALIVAWCVLMVGALLVFSLPNVYESNAQVYADTDAMQSPLLRGLALQPDVSNRLQIITRTLLSRPNLETVANKTGLGLRATSLADKDELLQKLGRSVAVRDAGTANLYNISYRDPQPAMAQKVVQAFLQILMNDTLGANFQSTASAQQFLQGQLKDYGGRLNDAERKLADFKKANVGYIPNEGGNDYFTRLQAAETQLQSLQDQYDTALAGRATTEQQMRAMTTNSASSGVDPRIQDINVEIASYQQTLNSLLLRYTNEYPDVIATKRMIAQLELRRTDLEKHAAGTSSSMGVASSNPVYQDMQKSLYSSQLTIGRLTTQITLQKRQLTDLKGKVDRITDVQTTLQQLTRNYDATKQKYNELLSRVDTAQMSQDASQSGNNLKFRVIDPPLVPVIAVSPKRGLLLVVALVMALAIGGGFAFFLHQIRPVFMSLKALREAGDYPVFGALSLVVSRTRARGRWRATAGFTAGVGLLVLVTVVGLAMTGHITNLVHHFFVIGGA
ncbi:MAG: XrtA system polysaccharide chain length determinant [Gammaproteobacteria bacterium]